jgi:hypothetical protein
MIREYSSSSITEEVITIENWLKFGTTHIKRIYNDSNMFTTIPDWCLNLSLLARVRLADDERQMAKQGIHSYIAEFHERTHLTERSRQKWGKKKWTFENSIELFN